VDFSKLQRYELVGVISSLLLLISLFLPWFHLSLAAADRTRNDAWICGVGDRDCTGWETFPINRILFLLAAAAPLILAYFILTSQTGKYPTGEVTMTVGFAVITLVLFNGLIDKPGSTIQEAGVGLRPGYLLALLAGLLMAGAGAFRSLESGGGAARRPPGTF
jgi:hypothetical protein